MGKLVPFHTTMEVEVLTKEIRLGGVVKKSNFMPTGERHMAPLHEEVYEKIHQGDIVRITYFADDDEVVREDGRCQFKPRGVRYEKWNKKNGGWDKVFEKMQLNS